MKLSPEEFIKEWNRSSGPTKLAAQFEMTVSAVQARAARYRKMGYGLKYFRLYPGQEPKKEKSNG